MSAPQTLRLFTGPVKVYTLAVVLPVNTAKCSTCFAGAALLHRDRMGSLKFRETACSPEAPISCWWEGAEQGASRTPGGSILHPRRSTRAPFWGWCCLSPWLYQSFGFLTSRVMPPIQIRKLFQSKQLFNRAYLTLRLMPSSALFYSIFVPLHYK